MKKSKSRISPQKVTLQRARLDQEFLIQMEEIEKLLALQSKHDQIRLQQWILKLRYISKNTEWMKNRNKYGYYLLDCLLANKIDEPFNKFPPEGPLPRIMPYQFVILNYMSLQLNQQRLKDSQSKMLLRKSVKLHKRSLTPTKLRTQLYEQSIKPKSSLIHWEKYSKTLQKEENPKDNKFYQYPGFLLDHLYRERNMNLEKTFYNYKEFQDLFAELQVARQEVKALKLQNAKLANRKNKLGQQVTAYEQFAGTMFDYINQNRPTLVTLNQIDVLEHAFVKLNHGLGLLNQDEIKRDMEEQTKEILQKSYIPQPPLIYQYRNPLLYTSRRSIDPVFRGTSYDPILRGTSLDPVIRQSMLTNTVIPTMVPTMLPTMVAPLTTSQLPTRPYISYGLKTRTGY